MSHTTKTVHKMYRRVMIGIAVVVLAVVIFVIWIYLYYTPFGLSERMEVIDDYVRTVTPLIVSDPAFTDIRIDPTTQYGGTIDIDGTVKSIEDLRSLQSHSALENAPAEIFWNVKIKEPVDVDFP